MGRRADNFGPFISIPYYRYVKEISPKDSAEKIVQIKDYIHILPSQLKISGSMNPEKRQRGFMKSSFTTQNLIFRNI